MSTNKKTALADPLPAKKEKVDLDVIRGKLNELNLAFAAEQLADLITRAVKTDMGPTGMLEELLRTELEQREERRVWRALKISGLPTGLSIANFDFAFQPSVERSRIEALCTCAWVKKKQTLLLLGPPGVGKTHLAVALGVKVVESGFSVAFFRLDELLHALREDAEVPPARLKGKKYMKPALLIIDEVGFQPFTRQEANLFFRLVSYRYGRGATCITSNKPIRDWPEMLAGDEVLAAAILDRLLHDSHVVNIKGRSYRLKDLEGNLTRQS
jgi:DNA replication protein DnaC